MRCLQILIKLLATVLISIFSVSTFATNAEGSTVAKPPKNYKLEHCTSPKSEADVIGFDYDKNGKVTEYKRTKEDIEKMIALVKQKIKNDPGIKKSKHWRQEMLTPAYYFYTLCGGKDDCGSKTCSRPSSNCFYGNIGVTGCRCS